MVRSEGGPFLRSFMRAGFLRRRLGNGRIPPGPGANLQRTGQQQSRAPSWVWRGPELLSARLDEYAHRLEESLVGRRHGVEPPLMQEQIVPQGMQIGEQTNQIAKAAASQSINQAITTSNLRPGASRHSAPRNRST